MERFNKFFVTNKLYSFIAFALALGFCAALLVTYKDPIEYRVLKLITDKAQFFRSCTRLIAIVYMLLPVLFIRFSRKAYFPVFILLGIGETLLPIQDAVYYYYTDEEGLGYFITVIWAFFSVLFSISAAVLSCVTLINNEKAAVVLINALLLGIPLIFYHSNSLITHLDLEALSSVTTVIMLYFSIAFFNDPYEIQREIYYKLPLDNQRKK